MRPLRNEQPAAGLRQGGLSSFAGSVEGASGPLKSGGETLRPSVS